MEEAVPAAVKQNLTTRNVTLLDYYTQNEIDALRVSYFSSHGEINVKDC